MMLVDDGVGGSSVMPLAELGVGERDEPCGGGMEREKTPTEVEEDGRERGCGEPEINELIEGRRKKF
jgi:hypothetical protein